MTGLLTDSYRTRYDHGAGHPETPAPFDAILQGLNAAGLVGCLSQIETRDATREELLLAPARRVGPAGDIRSIRDPTDSRRG